jgi:outer membrane protein assembly factor BamB
MVYAVTGAGTASGETHANSVVALDVNGLAVKDWYTPEGIGSLGNAAPTVFTYKGRQLIAASGRDGRYVLLDSASLGGSDHHTPLEETAKIFKGIGVSFESLANWQDKDGTAWVLASISGTIDPAAKLAITNGTITHGTIIAFKVEDTGDRITLTPAWTSRDMLNPAPPVIANGTVIALSQGDPGNHARLYVFDAATGQELFSSDESIASYAHHTSVAVGDGHAFFTTHDNTLYSFGIAIEH